MLRIRCEFGVPDTRRLAMAVRKRSTGFLTGSCDAGHEQSERKETPMNADRH
jgi:hypothetical protein